MHTLLAKAIRNGKQRRSIGNIKPLFPWHPRQRLPAPGCPPRFRTPPQPRAGRLAVPPAGRPPAAGRRRHRSGLGLGGRPEPPPSAAAGRRSARGGVPHGGAGRCPCLQRHDACGTPCFFVCPHNRGHTRSPSTAQLDRVVSPYDAGHVGVCPVDGAAGSPPAVGGGAQKNTTLPQPEQLSGIQGQARAGVPLSVSEIRRLFWRLVLATQQRVERILAWSAWRRWHQGIARYWHYKRRASP